MHILGRHDAPATCIPRMCPRSSMEPFTLGHMLLDMSLNVSPSVKALLALHRHKMAHWLSSNIRVPTLLVTKTRSIWKMLGPFATASCLTTIHQMSLAVLSRAACASMSTTTTTMRDRGDRYSPMDWAHLGLFRSPEAFSRTTPSAR